jgi:hypothetical protein
MDGETGSYLLGAVSNGFPMSIVPWAAAGLYCHSIVVRICLGGTKSLSLEFSLPVPSPRYISLVFSLPAFSKGCSKYYCFVTQCVFESYIVRFTLWSLAIAVAVLKYLYNSYFT